MLASSLNVELVYVILKSITQFAYVNRIHEGLTISQEKESHTTLEYDKETGDASLRLTQIKVKNRATWDPQGTELLGDK